MNIKLKAAIKKYIETDNTFSFYYCDNGIKKITFMDNRNSIPKYYSFTIHSFISSGKIEKPFFWLNEFTGSHNPYDLYK